MRVDGGLGGDDEVEEETEKTKKKKGKGKEKDGWEIVGGSRRCTACLKEDMECKINLAMIEK